MTTSDVSAYGVFPSFNNKTPKEGPRYIPMTFDFSSTDTWDVDMMQLQQAGKISTLQAFYVDNSTNTVELTITLGLGGQVIKVQPGYQGYMTALVNNVPKFSVSSPGGGNAIVFALNFPVVNDLWPASPNAEATETVVVSNLEAVGGDAIALGQTTASASLPVAIASDQSALAVKISDTSGNAITSTTGAIDTSISTIVATYSGAGANVTSLRVTQSNDTPIPGLSAAINQATLTTTASANIAASAATHMTRIDVQMDGYTLASTNSVTLHDGSGAVIASLAIPAQASATTGVAIHLAALYIPLANNGTSPSATLTTAPTAGSIIVTVGWQ